MLKTEIIAAIAHSINKAYCESLGDHSQVSFEEAPDNIKQSIIAGVEMHLANPDITPEQSHEAWFKFKEADGWVYGEVKDLENKTHPCMVTFEELPQEQRSKDFLFKAAVSLAKDLVHASDVAYLQVQVEQLTAEVARLNAIKGADKNAGGKAIRYIGMRQDWEDHLYSSGLFFTYGEIKLVPDRLAKKFLHHLDMFEEVTDLPEDAELSNALSAQDDMDEAEEKEKAQLLEQNAIFETLQHIEDMSKAGLVEYAEKNYSVKLNGKLKLDELKHEVKELVNKFGVL